MQAGFATSDITPAIGMEIPGNYFKQYHQRVHDPLKVRAAVFDDGATTIAFVGIDTLMVAIRPVLITAVRAAVEQHCAIPGGNILIATSHTHSGGPLGWLWPDDFAQSPPLVQTLLREHCINPDPLYHEWVVRQAVSAVREAHRAREEVLLSAGSGVEEQALFNRRFRMANGRVYTHPGKGNPQIVEPAGPIDPAVGMLAAWRRDGELLGCVVNYSCHCTTFTGGISADYVYYLERTIQGVMGSQATVVFLPGASADVTQLDNRSLRASEHGEWWSRHVGTRVGAEAVKVLATAARGDLAPLVAARQVLHIPRRAPSAERVAASRQIVEAGLGTSDRDTAWIFAKEIVILDDLLQREPAVAVEVQAIQVGPLVFLANPCEMFASSGLAIKAASPFPLTCVVSLANGNVGYVPPAEAFEPSGGGYETVLTSLSNLAIAADQQIVGASIELAQGLTLGTLPQLPQTDQPPLPWAYGVLGPDVE